MHIHKTPTTTPTTTATTTPTTTTATSTSTTPLTTTTTTPTTKKVSTKPTTTTYQCPYDGCQHKFNPNTKHFVRDLNAHIDSYHDDETYSYSY